MRDKDILNEVWRMEFWNNTMFLGNPLMEWAQALGFFIGSILLARLVYAMFKGIFKRWAARTTSKWDDVIVDQVEEPIALGIVPVSAIGPTHCARL